MDIRLHGLTNHEPPLFEDLVRDLAGRVPQALAIHNFPIIAWSPITRISSPLWAAKKHLFGERGFQASMPLISFQNHIASECYLDMYNPLTGERFSDSSRKIERCMFPSHVVDKVSRLIMTRPPQRERKSFNCWTFTTPSCRRAVPGSRVGELLVGFLGRTFVLQALTTTVKRCAICCQIDFGLPFAYCEICGMTEADHHERCCKPMRPTYGHLGYPDASSSTPRPYR